MTWRNDTNRHSLVGMGVKTRRKPISCDINYGDVYIYPMPIKKTDEGIITKALLNKNLYEINSELRLLYMYMILNARAIKCNKKFREDLLMNIYTIAMLQRESILSKDEVNRWDVIRIAELLGFLYAVKDMFKDEKIKDPLMDDIISAIEETFRKHTNISDMDKYVFREWGLFRYGRISKKFAIDMIRFTTKLLHKYMSDENRFAEVIPYDGYVFHTNIAKVIYNRIIYSYIVSQNMRMMNPESYNDEILYNKVIYSMILLLKNIYSDKYSQDNIDLILLPRVMSSMTLEHRYSIYFTYMAFIDYVERKFVENGGYLREKENTVSDIIYLGDLIDGIDKMPITAYKEGNLTPLNSINISSKDKIALEHIHTIACNILTAMYLNQDVKMPPELIRLIDRVRPIYYYDTYMFDFIRGKEVNDENNNTIRILEAVRKHNKEIDKVYREFAEHGDKDKLLNDLIDILGNELDKHKLMKVYQSLILFRYYKIGFDTSIASRNFMEAIQMNEDPYKNHSKEEIISELRKKAELKSGYSRMILNIIIQDMTRKKPILPPYEHKLYYIFALRGDSLYEYKHEWDKVMKSLYEELIKIIK